MAAGRSRGDRTPAPAPSPIDPHPPVDLLPAADRLFGDRLPLALSYAELLMTDGVIRGLIGPREATRVWERHLLNCAAVGELIPQGARVVDVGSGAGLPGIALAVARPDVSVTLVEPLARRTAFLSEAVSTLRLDRATVLRARAEEWARHGGRIDTYDVVTARAVAPLDRLAAWCLPLVSVGGRLLAIKGASAVEEITAHRDVIVKLGGGVPLVRQCGVGIIRPPTIVVVIPHERVIETHVRAGRKTGSRR